MGLKNKMNELLNPMVKKTIELIERDNEDEMVGVVVRLSKEIQKEENAKLMLELALIVLAAEIQEEEQKDV